MKHIRIFLAIVGLLVATQVPGLAQMPPEGGGRPHGDRLEKFRKMRLIEVLKLNEEDAIRFFAKQSADEDTIQSLMKSRNAILDEIDNSVQGKSSKKDLRQLAADILDIDQKIVAERQRFQGEIQKLLTPEQFGKYLVFERNFRRQVRDALEEMHGPWQERNH